MVVAAAVAMAAAAAVATTVTGTISAVLFSHSLGSSSPFIPSLMRCTQHYDHYAEGAVTGAAGVVATTVTGTFALLAAR